MSNLSKITIVDNGTAKELEVKDTAARSAAAAAQAELDSAKTIEFNEDIFDIDTASQGIIHVSVNTMTGATASSAGAAGIVPAPTAADVNKLLSGSGTWIDPPSSVSTSYDQATHTLTIDIG